MNEKYRAAKDEYISTNKTLRMISKEHKVDRHTFSNYLKSQNISTKRKTSIYVNIFEKIDNEEKAYWLGFLYADGYVRYDLNRSQYNIELTLAEKDICHIEKFKAFVNSNIEIKYRPKQKAYRFIVSSKKMCEDLIKLGCVQAKSLILTFPGTDKVSKHLVRHFIRGYFDGDGHIPQHTVGGTSIIGTYEFITYIINYYKVKDIRLYVDKRWDGNTISAHFNVKSAIIFLNSIYDDSTIYLTRKFNKYLYLMNCRVEKKLST